MGARAKKWAWSIPLMYGISVLDLRLLRVLADQADGDGVVLSNRDVLFRLTGFDEGKLSESLDALAVCGLIRDLSMTEFRCEGEGMFVKCVLAIPERCSA